MRRARKKPVRVNAYRLGEQSEGLDRLIKEGLVSQSDDGTFEVHTMETKDEKGETANAGDYVKLDAFGRPYPNKAEFFEKNHRHIDGDQYEQFPKDREVWMMGDAMCPEVEFLIEQEGWNFIRKIRNIIFREPAGAQNLPHPVMRRLYSMRLSGMPVEMSWMLSLTLWTEIRLKRPMN